MNVRCAEPLSPSVTLGESIDSAGAPSSSVIVRSTFAGCVIPWLFVAVPVTTTVLFASSRLLFTAVTVTVPVLLVCPAAIVSIGLALRRKSPPTVSVPAVAPTVTVVAALDRWSSVAVTVLTLPGPLSVIALGTTASVTVGAASSSMIVPVPLAPPSASVAFPGLLSVTMTGSSGSSVVSPVTATAMVRLVSPAANVSVPDGSAV